MDAIPGTLSAAERNIAPTDLVAEANHRIANSLTVLVSMVRMQSAAVNKNADSYSSADVRHLLDGIAARINTISQLHRIISHAGSDGVISLKPHLHDVTDALVAALSCSEQAVKVVHTGGDCMVQMRQVQPIVLMLCEIFINAMKYAHPTGVPLIMLVDSSISGDGRLVLTICDDGVGLPEGFDPAQSSGMGFKVMRSLAVEVGGQLQIRSTHLGLSFRLSLPAVAMAGTFWPAVKDDWSA
jgi:two-component sensor histidine kinase